jgi:hypothetical protein
MTFGSKHPMPFLLAADSAARTMVRALQRRRKVFNFPWPMSLLMKLTRWMPDWLLARQMRQPARAERA